MKNFLQSVLSRRSAVLDQLGRVALRFYLYRENAHFNPDLNGEHFLLRRLDQLGFSPESVFDIGANEGRWSDTVMKQWPEASCHLFEPMPSIVARLEQRFAGNPQITVHPFAVGGTDGSIGLHENAELSSHSFVKEGGEGAQMLSGESAFARAGIDRLDLCKIDAEGFDLAIIASLEDLLAHNRIAVLQFEHHALAVAYGVPFAEISSLFQRHGYRLGKMFPDGLREVRYGAPDWGYQVGPNSCAIASSHGYLFEQLAVR